MSFPFARGMQAAVLVVALAAAGCASAPPTSALTSGSQATLEGVIASIDTKPWTYDGNAIVLVDTATHGQVPVQLPARWNLCKAPPPQDVQALKAGDRVRATGTVSEPHTLVVCEHAGHGLHRAP